MYFAQHAATMARALRGRRASFGKFVDAEVNIASTVHDLPLDFQKALAASQRAAAVWNDITSLARNEWICWVTSGKKTETRGIRIAKGISKLEGGMRRPCCWPGCPHR